MARILLGWLCAGILVVQMEAAIVVLTDGSVLKGQVISETDSQIVIQTLLGEAKLGRDLIGMMEQTNPEPVNGAECKTTVNVSEAFGDLEDRLAKDLILANSGFGTAAFYGSLDRSKRVAFCS